MMMIWFVPVALAVGAMGTQTAFRSRHALKAAKKERSWWLLLVLAWLPIVCWFLAQFSIQD